MEVGPDDLRRSYRDLETDELLHLYRTGGLTGSAIAVLKEALDSREPGWEHRDDRWLQSDFESFLREAATLKIPDELGHFEDPLFVPAGPPVGEKEIQDAERRIGTPLPRSYKLFLQVLGPGCWCRANDIPTPAGVEAFAEGTWGVEGFFAIVDNVQGLGEFLAFNPADPEIDGERPVYYFSHDPYGYAKVADSFETWARECAAATRQGEDFYQQFDEAVHAKWIEYDKAMKAMKAPEATSKKWWQLWR
jgi:hypothetical protein